MTELLAVAVAIALVALLYSSVGHAGASGYIAVLSLAAFSPGVVKPTALILNILVATIGTLQFYRAGHFSWRLFWPFALLAIPAAFLGGYLNLPTAVFKAIVGVVLIGSAIRLVVKPGDPKTTRQARLWLALFLGAAIGFLAGLTGTGGGIFLTPLLMLAGWAKTKEAAAVSVAFILVNSVAGITGFIAQGQSVPNLAWLFAVAAIAGGTIGSYLGSRRLPVRVIQLLLAAVLVAAGIKLLVLDHLTTATPPTTNSKPDQIVVRYAQATTMTGLPDGLPLGRMVLPSPMRFR
jgi:uncharacterized protein